MKTLAIASVAAAVLFGVAGATAQQAPPEPDGNRHAAPPASKRQEPAVVYPDSRSITGSGTAEKDRSSGSAARNDQDHRNRSATDQNGGSSSQSAAGSESKSSAPSRRTAGESSPHQTTGRAGEYNRRSARDRTRHEGARSSQNERRQSSQQSRSETTGQSVAPDNRRSNQSFQRDSRPSRDARTDRADRRGVSLSPEQRTRITTRLSARIDRMNVRPIPRSEFSVRIGGTVPRHVSLYRLPPDVVSIYPRFRGDQFVVVEDEIVVVEPGGRRIVAVLPREGDMQASRETTGVATREERLRLSPEARRVIHTTVLREPACHYEQRLDFFLFVPLPRTVQVCEFPRQVVEEVPEIRPYRYVVQGDNVVVVDPAENRVIEVID